MNSGVGKEASTFAASRVVNVQFANQLQSNLADVSALFKQVSKGSKTVELLSRSSRNFAGIDSNLTSSEEAFHKLSALSVHLGYQQEAIQRSLEQSSGVREQIQSLNALISRSGIIQK